MKSWMDFFRREKAEKWWFVPNPGAQSTIQLWSGFGFRLQTPEGERPIRILR